MLLKIAHRINTIEQLQQVPTHLGIELDIRYQGSELILHHDPFVSGQNFDKFLSHYKHAFLILNVKTEGVEEAVQALMDKHGITNYFYLDLSLPYMIRYLRRGWTKVALRYSEFEPIELALRFAGMAEWVWVDCFTHLPLDAQVYAQLKQHFKICLVSPELQGHDKALIAQFKEQLQGLPIDAVCTKYPELW